jgi:hypothetical protein
MGPLLLTIAAFAACAVLSRAAAVDTTSRPTSSSDPWCRDNCSSLGACQDRFGFDFVHLKVRTAGFSNLDGSLTGAIYHGDSVSRQTFETQLILDVASALGVSPCRLHIASVAPEKRKASAVDSEIDSVYVALRLFPSDQEAVRNLTAQIQDPSSAIFQPHRHVSSSIDPLYGLVAVDWDHSLKLSIDMDIVGQGLVKSTRNTGAIGAVGNGDIRYLNQGSERWCFDTTTATDKTGTPYCEFEEYFRNDLSYALELDPSSIDVLFVKPDGVGSVVVSFRLLPDDSTDRRNSTSGVGRENNRIDQLVEQISDVDSALYRGNVTFRVDPTWGVSNKHKAPRKESRYLVRSVQPSTSADAYERCKATHRCSRGWTWYNQSSSVGSSTMQTFAGGRHDEVPLFADFEDWRQGSQGWKWSGSEMGHDYTIPPTGAHWSPFDFDALGPQIPSYNTTSNNGLVLNSESLEKQLEQQTKWMDRLRDYIGWLGMEMNNTSSLDAMTRSRSDIRRQMTRTMNEYEDRLLREEKPKHATLSQTQCRSGKEECALLFNTSSLELTGIINATGLVDTTPDGTEVAVWTFDSIDIDEYVNVTVTGQRAMALLSRSSVRINADIVVPPGTLGGFPGGYSISRRPSDRLNSVCAKDIDPTKIVGEKCIGDRAITTLLTSSNGSGWPPIASNNVNGPGSASARVYLNTIETTAPIENRAQTIRADTNRGQTLAGGFKLHFNGYSTPFLHHDATALDVKEAIESSLNPTDLAFMDKVDRIRGTDIRQGIGKVTVVRESIGTSGGSLWTVTYDSGVGIHGNLTATDLLEGKGSSISIQTPSEGNTIEGTFSLSLLGDTTRPIPHDVSAHGLERTLLEDISTLVSVRVLRSDFTNKCNSGLCRNGPSKSGGYVWTLSLATQVGNVSPTSPTSTEFDGEGAYANLTATNNLTGCIDDVCPEIVIGNGHANSHVQAMKKLAQSKPFSLAYGGAGGSHGGAGGQGFVGSNPVGSTYGDDLVTNLHGGSGGALGLAEPFEIVMLGGPRARGGSGGGAIEIVAANDISIGPNATISCSGQEGFTALMTGGGGGSGGTVLLAAGGSIRHQGTISVKGGAGGAAKQPSGHQNLADGHGGGGGGGRIAMYAESIVIEPGSRINREGGECSVSGIDRHTNDDRQQRSCDGENGTLHQDSRLWHKMHVDRHKGAAGTTSSLRLSASARYEAVSPGQSSSSRPSRRTLATKGGPEFDLGLGGPKKPGRISFFVQIGASTGGTKRRGSKDWGAVVEFRSMPWSQLATNPDSSSSDTAFIGIHIGRAMFHGANIRAIPHDDTHLRAMRKFFPETEPNKWYKVDVRLNWLDMQYDIFLDDTLVVRKAEFAENDGIQSFAIANFDSSADVWLDEIFVGDDVTMGFRCPNTDPAASDGGASFVRPNRRGWKASEIGGASYAHEMQRHESHVSRRPLYNRDEDIAVIKPFDGSGHEAFTSDAKFRLDANARDSIDGTIDAGSLLKVDSREMTIEELPPAKLENPNLQYHGQTPRTYVWYGEHDNAPQERDGYHQSASEEGGYLLSGGVAACSTTNFVSWRNEGIMLHNTNLTDMVRGGLANSTFNATGPYHIERPKVLYNNSTGKYVMWMIVDNEARDLAMAGIAVSEYATGPFDFVRSFYPDGNHTRDQTLLQEPDGSAYLIRSYYDNVEFVLPSAMMQPTWESVKDANGNIDHALTYHRAQYEPQYDDYHDIYVQRWRTEDKQWKVVCVDRITGAEREVPFGKEHLNHDGEVCNDPFEYKKVLGQGDPTQFNTKDGIPSRFLDPDDPANNAWRPDSVPGVKAQPWSANYRDGECGIRQLDDGNDNLDPNLPDRDVPDRGSCSNIADNPTHPTAPDKLIGRERVVQTRRAKFIAISRLTNDYLDTTGQTTRFEGEMEEGVDLISLFEHANEDIPFGWSFPAKADEVTSTFEPLMHSPHFTQADDFDTRYHQYISHYNDRATYSTACQLDGECPVDFASQLTSGHV